MGGRTDRLKHCEEFKVSALSLSLDVVDRDLNWELILNTYCLHVIIIIPSTLLAFTIIRIILIYLL